MITASKNPAAVVLGRLGGLKGGYARAMKLSPERRKEIARNAIRVRWGKLKSSIIDRELSSSVSREAREMARRYFRAAQELVKAADILEGLH